MQKRCLRMHSMQVYTQQANRWEMDSQAVWNGTAKINGWRDEKIFQRMNGWRKFLNGCSQMDERLKKIFEWTKSNRWTAAEK